MPWDLFSESKCTEHLKLFLESGLLQLIFLLCLLEEPSLNLERNTFQFLYITHQVQSDLILFSPLGLYETTIMEYQRAKVKSLINKEEITFTCCQGPALLQDWCSHIKSAGRKVSPKLWVRRLHRCCFFLFVFFGVLYVQAMFSCIIQDLILGFFFVCSFGNTLKCVFVFNVCMFLFFFFLSCLLSSSLSSEPKGLLFTFILSEPSFKMQGFLPTGTEARKWEMTYTV